MWPYSKSHGLTSGHWKGRGRHSHRSSFSTYLQTWVIFAFPTGQYFANGEYSTEPQSAFLNLKSNLWSLGLWGAPRCLSQHAHFSRLSQLSSRGKGRAWPLPYRLLLTGPVWSGRTADSWVILGQNLNQRLQSRALKTKPLKLSKACPNRTLRHIERKDKAALRNERSRKLPEAGNLLSVAGKKPEVDVGSGTERVLFNHKRCLQMTRINQVK